MAHLPTSPAPMPASRISGHGGGLVMVLGLIAWAAALAVPLVGLAWQLVHLSGQTASATSAGPADFWPLTVRSFGLAAIVAVAAVVLGYAPGKLLGMELGRAGSTARPLLLFLLLSPLLLPSYVLYYAWSLPVSPTGLAGDFVSRRPDLARLVGQTTSTLVVILWFWPLAALLLSQGWRNLDRSILENATLDARGPQRFWRVTLPLLARPIGLALGVCFSLALAEFTTFHLAGLRTLGTELAVVFDLSGSSAAVVRLSWVLVAPALLVAVAIWRSPLMHVSAQAAPDALWRAAGVHRKSYWAIFLTLLGLSLLLPVVLLASSVRTLEPLRQFLTLHLDELGYSAAVVAVAAGASLLISLAALVLAERANRLACPVLKTLSGLVHVSVLLGLFLPPALLAVCLLEALTLLHLPPAIRQSWVLVSLGLTARYAGAALILTHLLVGSRDTHLTEMASVDGASAAQAWRHVHLPRLWPLPVGAMLLVGLLGMTEIPATMILLPPGLPNFAQRLMNQMHYARDQQVIASCLVLLGFYALLAGLLTGLLRRLGRLAMMLGLVALLGLGGCKESSAASAGRYVASFGRTGTGNGEFLYPRAIDLCADGSLVIVDKAAHVQRFGRDGTFLGGFAMPQSDVGKPTGISTGPDGNLYVADTHYHRVMVFTPQGQIVRQWGRFGQEDGCFIYPTDVAFASGRILVSEYGGNDRISVFTQAGEFLHSFGSPGTGTGQFARPQSMAVDAARSRLYVSDACNHRIAVYDLSACLEKPGAQPLSYLGQPGTGPGDLRFPYGLALRPDGALVVAEYGNNRIQIFSPDGKSLGGFGQAGREAGQMAYPWAVAVDGQGRAFVVDSGNNRIQQWQL